MADAAILDRDAVVARLRAHPMRGQPAELRTAFRQRVLGGAGRPDDGPLTFRPVDRAPRMAPVIWFHGGGYVFGGPDTHARIGEYLCERHGLTVHLPRYPLAPDHGWPVQRDSALEFVDDVAAASGCTPILAGDSSGGHLALVVALARAREGQPAAALLLCSPNTDRSGLSRTRAANAEHDPMVDPEADDALARMCFADRDSTDREMSPLLDDLSLLPPTWIEVGAEEVLLDDSRLLAERARAAGAGVELVVTPGLLHMAQVWARRWDLADASLDRAAAFAVEHGADRDAEGQAS